MHLSTVLAAGRLTGDYSKFEASLSEVWKHISKNKAKQMKTKQDPKIKILNFNQNKTEQNSSNAGAVRVIFWDMISIYISICHAHPFGIAIQLFHLQSLGLQTSFVVSLQFCIGLPPQPFLAPCSLRLELDQKGNDFPQCEWISSHELKAFGAKIDICKRSNILP